MATLWTAACGDGDPDLAGPPPVANRPPLANGTIPPQTIAAGQAGTIDVSPYFSDPDGDALSYTAASSNAGVAGASATGSSVTVTALAKGVATVTVTARDPQGLLAQQRLEVTVPNRAPDAIGAIPAQAVFASQTASVDASSYFRDPDGDPLTYTATSSNAEVATVTVAGATLTIRAVAPGVAVITVGASDPDGGVAQRTVQVTVPNRTPEAVGTIPRRTLSVGETAMVDLSSYFRDPDGGTLSYAATSSNSGVATAAVSGDSVVVTGLARGDVIITVTARDPAGLSASSTFGATVMASDPRFQIELVFATLVTPTQEAAFRRAAERWMTILAPTELPDQIVNDTIGCGRDPRFDRHVETVDDLLIVAAVGEIDGPHGTLGQAGYCRLRLESTLPFYGRMEFDAADLDRLERRGDLEEVILHEMGHVLGIGALWNHFGLLRDPASETEAPDTHFTGPLAIEAFDEAGGTGYEGAKVPVENTGGQGTWNGHWRQAVLVTELMTGYVTEGASVPSPLSAITIQSLADLGYTVDLMVADPYRLPNADAARLIEPGRLIPYGDDVWRGPIVIVDADGRIVRVIPG